MQIDVDKLTPLAVRYLRLLRFLKKERVVIQIAQARDMGAEDGCILGYSLWDGNKHIQTYLRKNFRKHKQGIKVNDFT